MNQKVISLAQPRVSECGGGAFLLDAEGPLTLETQKRIWALADRVRDWEHVLDVQPGMNNLLVVVGLDSELGNFTDRLLLSWRETAADRELGKILEVGVVYGGELGEDLQQAADLLDLSREKLVEMHAAGEYIVFAPGVTPGFGYLFGLNPRLFLPRRQTPVLRVTGSAVLIAGLQSNLGAPRRPDTPLRTPTGWYAIGTAPDVPVPFDLEIDPPNLVSMGDRIRFRPERIEK